jgi:hypothetical protein
VPFGVVLVLLLVAGLGLGRVLRGPLRLRGLVADLADPEKRGVAYRTLYEDVRQDAIPALIEVAADPEAPMHQRSEAVELLGRIGGSYGDTRPLPTVLALAEPELVLVRIEALGRLRGEEALAEVLEALRGPDVPPKFPALRVLADWRDADTARLLPDVEPFLEHEQAGLREFAVKFMGARRHAPAVPALVGKLRDPDGTVRQMAAWSLAQIGTQDAVAAVQSAVETGAVNPEGL